MSSNDPQLIFTPTCVPQKRLERVRGFFRETQMTQWRIGIGASQDPAATEGLTFCSKYLHTLSAGSTKLLINQQQ